MKEKMWTGRTDGITDKIADDFNSSIKFDSRMYKQDIEGSMAHALMLGLKNIITPQESEEIIKGLEEILIDIESGKTAVDLSAEDIHMFIEQELTSRIGEVGKKLHTARSRNDQVAIDLRMYLKEEIDYIKVAFLISLVVRISRSHREDRGSIPLWGKRF